MRLPYAEAPRTPASGLAVHTGRGGAAAEGRGPCATVTARSSVFSSITVAEVPRGPGSLLGGAVEVSTWKGSGILETGRDLHQMFDEDFLGGRQ